MNQKSLKERAEAVLDDQVEPVTMEHTPYGEVYHGAKPLNLSPVDLGIIQDQQALMRVIAGLQDQLGGDAETEEEANDFDWEEPDPFSTEHTLKDMVEEEPDEPKKPPANPAEPPKPADEGE